MESCYTLKRATNIDYNNHRATATTVMAF